MLTYTVKTIRMAPYVIACSMQHGSTVLTYPRSYKTWFLGGLSLHLNHLIASHMRNFNGTFGTLPFGLFGSNLDTMDLETYPRTFSGNF